MQKTNFKRILSIILCIVIVAAISLFTIGCTDNKTENPETEKTTVSDIFRVSGSEPDKTTSSEKLQVIGQGEKTFFFIAEDREGNETKWEVHTDGKTVGEALLSEKIIEGEDGAYGLYVKTVNGITLDYEKDGLYWAFYEGEDYALTGVDLTEIAEGQTYAFRPQK